MKTGISLRREVSDLPLSRFPLRGKAGAGGFPPRRDTCRASKKRWHVPCSGSPHKRGSAPLCIPRCFPADCNFNLAETLTTR